MQTWWTGRANTQSGERGLTGIGDGQIEEADRPIKQINAPAVPGSYYEAEVPDTLDLAERARLGLNHFLDIMREEYNCEMPLTFDFAPPVMNMHGNALGACQSKAMEAMAFLRLMTGSREGLDREAKMLEMMVSMFGKDGLHWVPGSPDKEWLNIPEPFVMVHGQGRMLRAMVAWSQYTGNPAWIDRINGLVNGIDRIVVHKDGYAYFPVYGHYEGEYLRSCYTQKGWRDTVEPTYEKFGEEGSLFNHQGHVPGGMATSYLLTGNKNALRLSGELVRFLSKPKLWADWENGDYPSVVGAEHAHWQGHWHGHLNTLRAILDYAVVTGAPRLMAFVRDGYEWARQMNLARIGYFDSQGCGCGRIIGLAVKLSLAGVGDCWEDVDQYIRNHGIEMQIVPGDMEPMRGLSEGNLDESVVRLLAKSVGGYAGRLSKDCTWLCCSPHGNVGIFYAWDGTLRYSDGVARVNLLLNRASPWMDVDSHLPYEGKVVLRNKQAREVFVRVPLWADRDAAGCKVGNREVAKVWFDRYLRFEGITPGDVLTLEFPVAVTTEEWTLGDQVHTCRFRGNTLIEISPPLQHGSPLYKHRAEDLKATKAPVKKVTRYVTPQVLQW